MRNFITSIRHYLHLRSLYRESDFGRRFGWEILQGDVVLGELEYIRWNEHSQFWHTYRIQPAALDLAGEDDPQFWRAGIELRSRAVPTYSTSNFIARSAGEIVSVRALDVPWMSFRTIPRETDLSLPCNSSVGVVGP